MRSSPDLYPLIDYVNFKGEGISAKETAFDAERGATEGWGMRWLLIEMEGTDDRRRQPSPSSRAPPSPCSTGASATIPPAPRWRLGWHKRCDTYRRPLA